MKFPFGTKGLPETNISHLKMGAPWKRRFLLESIIFGVVLVVYKILLDAGPFYLNKLSCGNLSTFGSLSTFYVRSKECSSRECMNL